MKSIKYVLGALLLLTTGTFFNSADACTKVTYQGPNGTVITARSMDWKEDIKTNLWVFPRGMERTGESGPNTVKWKSKYGSVVASAYDFASTDGLNEKGLGANLLWLAESEFPEWTPNKPTMSVAVWAQYVLDNFATVAEAVNALSKEEFHVITDEMPGQSRLAAIHMSISDASGDNAIFEYINNKLVIHHDRSYQVMTNSPTFDKQLTLNEYWKEIGGTVMLPGTNRAADRFVRASFYINAIPQTDDRLIAAAGAFSVIRNCSVPYGISTPNEPNISSTRWRILADHKHLVYYYESTTTPNIFWVNLKDLDLSENAPVKKLDLINGEIYAGNTVKDFVNSPPFKFAGI